MVKKCTPCIRRAKYVPTRIVPLHNPCQLCANQELPLFPLRSPFSSFERRPAYPCAALAGIPALECARAAKGCRPRTAPRALLPKLRLDGAGFHPALGPGERGFPDAHSHYHVPSSTSARSLRAPLCKHHSNELLRPCSCWLSCLVRAQIRKRGAPRGRPLQRWRSFCLRLRARNVGIVSIKGS